MAKVKVLQAAECSGFCSQVALILGAGLPLYDGMETLAEASKGSPYEAVYADVSHRVNEAGSLYEAVKDDERFPVYLREMVGIGETSGQLEEVMKGLTDYYGREDRIRTAIVNAVTYPLVLSVMLILIITIMLWKVLPVFRRVLSSMGVVMTASGTTMMNLGSTIGWVVLVLILLIMVFAIVCVILMHTDARPKVLTMLRKMFPPAGRISMKLASSRVASVLSMMLRSGFPTGEAFRLLPAVITDEEAKDRVNGIRKELDAGESFADAVSHSKLFDGLHDRMIRMGVAAGREDQVMENIAKLYEEQVEDGIGNLISIIEPTLIALLAVVIGAILLSVMMPMAGILSSML